MLIKQFEIWIADLNPQIGREPGKTRPVLVLQTNLLNKVSHPSTIICPITTNVVKESDILRVHLKKGVANLHENCDILIDQIRAIDNKQLIKKVGNLPVDIVDKVKENILIVLDLNSASAFPAACGGECEQNAGFLFGIGDSSRLAARSFN